MSPDLEYKIILKGPYHGVFGLRDIDVNTDSITWISVLLRKQIKRKRRIHFAPVL